MLIQRDNWKEEFLEISKTRGLVKVISMAGNTRYMLENSFFPRIDVNSLIHVVDYLFQYMLACGKKAGVTGDVLVTSDMIMLQSIE